MSLLMRSSTEKEANVGGDFTSGVGLVVAVKDPSSCNTSRQLTRKETAQLPV